MKAVVKLPVQPAAEPETGSGGVPVVEAKKPASVAAAASVGPETVPPVGVVQVDLSRLRRIWELQDRVAREARLEALAASNPDVAWLWAEYKRLVGL